MTFKGSASIWRAKTPALHALAILFVLALAGCSGTNKVVVKESYKPTANRNFTSVEFFEEKPDVEVPQEIRNKIKTESGLVVEKFSKLGDYARRQSGDKSSRMVSVRYKIKSYEPGNSVVRKYVGLFGFGVSTIEVEAHFYDEKQKEIGNILASHKIAADNTAMYIMSNDNEEHAQKISSILFEYWYDTYYAYGNKKKDA